MKKTALRILSLLTVLAVLLSLFSFSYSALDTVVKPSGTIVVIPPKNPPSGKSVTITYECCENCNYKKTLTYAEGKEIKAEVRGGCLDGKNAFVCWADENGNIVSFPMDMPLGGMRLTAVWKTPKLPKTGDDSSAALWMLLMGMAGAAWLALRRRAQNN